MEIKKAAVAGTMESSDIMVTVEPADGISVELESSVKEQFGARIEEVIRETLQALGVERAAVTAVDKGALDCTVRARVESAVFRAAEKSEVNWEVLP